MCGIGGYVDFNAPIERRLLELMTRALARRGPDAAGVIVRDHCGLAHARLSIIDVAGSPQPMSAPEANLDLVYNGEIYNYLELRRVLGERGLAFETNGDTEVLLRTVQANWSDRLAQLDGMFAFGAWDGRQQRLLLGRDPLGEKPLFYATPSEGVLVFGSEVKVVLEHPAVSRELDRDALRQALRFRAVYGDGTLHAGVKQLEPGTWLEFSRSGLKRGRFFDLVRSCDDQRGQTARLTESQLVERGRELFERSVEERLVADSGVPVGAFLSGGLDSSLIVAAMRNARPNTEIRTFSVGFAGDPHSELPHARLVADTVGSVHTQVEVGPEAYIRRFAELSACRDAPVSQPADIAIAEMSHVAKRHVKVVLSGEGADEVFGGYPKYGLANAPRVFGAAIALVGATRTSQIAGILGLDRRRALVAARALSEPSEVDRQAQWFSYFDRQQLNALFPDLGWDAAAWSRTTANHSRALERLETTDRLTRMQITDCLNWLPGNMLERGDRMTMAEGLEVRPPFLDTELCAFGLSLPANLKVRGRAGKWIVRQWGNRLLPRSILERKKWGFRTPLEEWFRGPLRDFLVGYVSATNSLSNSLGAPAEIRALLDAHFAGHVDAGETLWTLLSAEVWYQDVFQRAS